MQKILELLHTHFNITEIPVEFQTYRKAYKAACISAHPDHGGDEGTFQAMFDAHKVICKASASHEIFSDRKPTVEQTTCGTPLMELGLGLGPTTNGRPCVYCKGRGYEIFHGKSWKVCEVCDVDGTLPRVFLCKNCKGTGIFTQKNGRVVKCRTCNAGLFAHPRLRSICSVCNGTKTVYDHDENAVFYHKCPQCKGTGEIEIMNPVLPKGLLTQLNKKEG